MPINLLKLYCYHKESFGLLIAKSDEKEKVLRNLFGTELYQLFSENLKERLKIANQEIQETQQKIELKTEQLHWSEEPEPTMTLLKNFNY